MKRLNCLPVALVFLAFAPSAGGKFAVPTPAPIDRLIANTTAYIAEKPEDAHGYYILARIHYLAFANRSGLVSVYKRQTPPRVAEYWQPGSFVGSARNQQATKMALDELGYSSATEVPPRDREDFRKAYEQKRRQLEEEGWVPEKLEATELFEHAGAAMENFQKAIELDSKNALYRLGLASLLEQYVEFLGEIEAEQVPEQFRKLLLSKAKDMYHTAYSLSIREDLRHKHRPIAGLRSLVGYEAGNAYVRLSANLGIVSKEEEKEVAKVKNALQKLDSLPRGAITPIIFSLEKHASAADLLTPHRHVRFDLDGDGSPELWPWVKPTTGILVWDPEGKGVVRWGRQMFGSVSWWLFFEDGYHALDALDDSRDAVLTGGELTGIRVWFDRDGNGESGQGEVVSLKELQIVSISTKASGDDCGFPMSVSGIVLSDGRTMPTYDWLTWPLTEQADRSLDG